jgi:hypothetical protein
MPLPFVAGSADGCQCCGTGSKCTGKSHALLNYASAVLVLGAGGVPRPSLLCLGQAVTVLVHAAVGA